jgi:hypothetical protein
MYVVRVQVPMARQGVVESLMAVLARITGSTSEALAVQQAACGALQNLAVAADNRVRAGRELRGVGVGGRNAAIMKLFARLVIVFLRCLAARFVCVFFRIVDAIKISKTTTLSSTVMTNTFSLF